MNESILKYIPAIIPLIVLIVMARITYYKCVIDKLNQKLKRFKNERNT